MPVRIQGKQQIMKFVTDFSRLKGQVDAGTIQDQLADDFLNIAKAEAPLGRTGNLRDSHHIATKTRSVIVLVNAAPYSNWVHEGFVHKSGKKIIGNPWMKRAAEEAVRSLSQRLADALEAQNLELIATTGKSEVRIRAVRRTTRSR